MTPYTIGYFAGMFDYRPGVNDTYPVIALSHMDDYPLTPNVWRVFTRDNHQCVYCGLPDQLTLDHVVPVSRGGSDDIENLVTCCHRCNSIKGARTPEEWLQATSLLNHHGV